MNTHFNYFIYKLKLFHKMKYAFTIRLSSLLFPKV